MTDDLARFRAARDFLIAHRTDQDGACAGFRWPRLTQFNWALDHFDEMARGNTQPALVIEAEDGTRTVASFERMSERSSQVACWLQGLGLARGDRVLLMLGNELPLWETMLACIKLGLVMIPATTLLSRDDLVDRFTRGRVRAVVAAGADAARFDGLDAHAPGPVLRIAIGPVTAQAQA
ncbi:MAG: AMP-binding protein, partial [Betaproteobacteria bacterium]